MFFSFSALVVVVGEFLFLFNLDSCRLIIYAASLSLCVASFRPKRQTGRGGGGGGVGGLCMKCADGAFDLGLSYARKAGARFCR